MQLGELFDAPIAEAGEAKTDDPAVIAVPEAADKAGLHGPVHQLHGAVVAEQQVVGHLPDGGTGWVGMAPDSQEQLVLGGGEAHGRRLLLAPAQKTPQAGTKL